MTQDDDDVIGLILGGSRGKGFQTKYSDYDIYLIVKDGKTNSCKSKYRPYLNEKLLDIVIMDVTSFKKYALFGNSQSWDTYNFVRLQAVLDKTGEIQNIIDVKSTIPENKLRRFVETSLDCYVNFVYRSLKCLRDGNLVCARLEAARAVPFFIDALFALDSRIAPYYKYLEWELTKYPVHDFPMTSSEILNSLIQILNSADRLSQQGMLKIVNEVFRRKGYQKALNSWERKLDWMLTWLG